MYNTGEKPGKGKYKCTVCDFVIELMDDNEELPVCEVCGEETWAKEE